MAGAPIIELAEVTKTFVLADAATHVLKGVSMSVDVGEFVALRGASGSGKSTILHILGLLDKVSSGSYRLDGQDVSGLSDDELAMLRNKKFGFVFQSFYLIPYATALDNVMLPGLYSRTPTRRLRERGTELLGLVGLSDRLEFKPPQLSGGQQQRVAIARALLNDPDIILADEPTGQLDSATSTEIMELLAGINVSGPNGKTIVVVTHDPITAAYCRREINVSDGRIVA
jgi:putative ABC transport system ATP-binding protein